MQGNIKPFRIRAKREIIFDAFMFPEGESIIVDETVMKGAIHLADRIYNLPVDKWIGEGLVSVETCDIKTHVYNNCGIPYLEPMFQYMRENGLSYKVGAEIGVFNGENAVRILNALPIAKLYLIDPYHENTTFQPWNIEYFAKVKEETIKRLVPYNDRIEWIFRRSDEAYRMIGEPLDFAYHDSAHTIEIVFAECMNFRSLIKAGGIQGGHDYGSFYYMRGETKQWEHDRGVIFAVSKFLELYPRDLYWSNLHANWWTIKSEEEQ
jgi:hypothetical protein